MKSIGRLVSAVAVAAILAALPPPAEAATRTLRVKPSALSPFNGRQEDTRTGILNGGLSGPVLFWKVLRLPRGAKLRGLSYRRVAALAEETIVGIDRVRPGRTPAWQRLYSASSTDVTPVGTTGTVVRGTLTGVSRRVRRGWTYFLLVQATPGASVGTVTVRYSVP